MNESFSFFLQSPVQSDLFSDHAPLLPKAGRPSRSGAFTDNMKLPIHRWFRYSAGFSAEWAQQTIREAGARSCRVLDPFAGSGTTLIAAQSEGAESVGFEAHPFVARVARAKLEARVSAERLQKLAEEVIAAAADLINVPAAPNVLLDKCYSPEALGQLNALRLAYLRGGYDGAEGELLWLLLTSILRECSHVGTAQWQYVLPNKSKSKVKQPFEAFRGKAAIICADLKSRFHLPLATAEVLLADARSVSPDAVGRSFDLIVTSPPYPNNYDYADATRLEMSFWGDVATWGDLHVAVRQKLLCSCSQHSAAERFDLETLLQDDLLAPISSEISSVCRTLADIRETKGGKKTYHTMVAAYFIGLAQVWQSLRSLTAKGGMAHFVVGDSAPYGVYVPNDRWLGELALAAGFSSFSFKKLRDRNTKWKNRKHTVPLHEGILRVVG